MRMNGRLNGCALRIFLAGSVLTGSTAILFASLGVRINTTDSVPQGLYLVTKDGNAPLVEFCPQGIVSTLSIVRGYRPAGICADGAAPLLKPVIAHSGDMVALTIDGIRVNGMLLPNTAPQPADGAGRTLAAWPSGQYTVAPQSIWVASNHPNSFDSRYFGPIPAALIRHRLKPLWVLGSRNIAP